MTTEEQIRLTQFSKGGGCGCKIAPSVLQEILKTENKSSFPQLLVGNESSDDAAVYQLDENTAIVSTTDFFMPIVDDAFAFGQIASANAISDVYAMGGKPLMAIAILGWPAGKISPGVAQKVLDGGRSICAEAGIPLAGGHTIDSLEPIFGLAVTGAVHPAHVKKNNGAQEGDLLFLTKPLGVGVLSTAVKKGVLTDEHYAVLLKQLTTLNKAGEALGKLQSVRAMTDVTGFGLLGHIIEMAEGSGVSVELNYSTVQKIEGLDEYLKQGIGPGATARNWNSYGHKVQFENGINTEEALKLLPDPQTNGGLLIASNDIDELREVFLLNGLTDFLTPIGRCIPQKEKAVYVRREK
ncbi:selenide, water dikinase SelD [Flavisolibacter ginsenosidimutans]|uniref:Selenide, water dikinase n=1 Tax=Flavisolibacter ginsenosidimutans TaxID=661481 RepID=A0A5B8UL71_9BACT|nr:selenide, water dikinase SelD [Flavisolibacter ginsenosidimutans]QEC57417.1 selenide, water dikinase SelD [Flavisolibacter ginsenosidimutans]